MSKIAVACDGKDVAGHFGHCENFWIFDIVNNEVVNGESINNPGHKPGFLPNYLADMGVKVIISGGMGGAAVEIFNERGIEVIVGVSTSAEDAARKYLKGELKSTGSICHEHEHAHECGSH